MLLGGNSAESVYGVNGIKEYPIMSPLDRRLLRSTESLIYFILSK